jgi:putative oxidoreductase
MRNFALLLVRLTIGSLLAGHGAQKLFGWFGGHGLEGTAGWMESIRLRPGKVWAMLAGLSEFGGGLLILLGFLNPLGPLAVIGAMGMATAKVHWGKPIWVTSGGAELPITNMSVALALALSGPGDYSLDHLLGVKLPRRLVLIPGLILATASVAFGLYISTRPEPQPEAQPEAQPQPQLQARPEPQPEAQPEAPEMAAGVELQTGHETAQSAWGQA